MEYTYLFVLTGVEPSSLTCNTSSCFQMLGDLVLYSSQGPHYLFQRALMHPLGLPQNALWLRLKTYIFLSAN